MPGHYNRGKGEKLFNRKESQDESIWNFNRSYLFCLHRSVSSDCDQGRILFFIWMLAVFWGLRDYFSGNIPVDAEGNPFGSNGGGGLQLPVEHFGAEGAGKTSGKGVVSEKSPERRMQKEKTLNAKNMEYQQRKWLKSCLIRI